MHGFPQASKDLTIAAGMMATMGSLTTARNVSTHDGTIAEHIRRQGTVSTGKTNMPELGLGSYTYNRVYDTTYNA